MAKIDSQSCENCGAPRTSSHICSPIDQLLECKYPGCNTVFDDSDALFTHIYEAHPDPRGAKGKARAPSVSPYASTTSRSARQSYASSSSPSTSRSRPLSSSSRTNSSGASSSSLIDALQPYDAPNVQYELSHMVPLGFSIDGDVLRQQLNTLSWKNKKDVKMCTTCHIYGHDHEGHLAYDGRTNISCSTLTAITSDLAVFRSGINFKGGMGLCYGCGLSMKAGYKFYEHGRVTKVHPDGPVGRHCPWRDTVFVYLFWGLGPEPNATVLKLINESGWAGGLDLVTASQQKRLAWLSGKYHNDDAFLISSPILVALDAVWKVKGLPVTIPDA